MTGRKRPLVVLPDATVHRLTPAGIFLMWCRRVMILTLLGLWAYDREWGFVIVLLMTELLGIFIGLINNDVVERDTIDRVHAAHERGK